MTLVKKQTKVINIFNTKTIEITAALLSTEKVLKKGLVN